MAADTLRDRQRGAATAELVVATPLLLMLFLLIVQFAVWQHAAHLAAAAAQEGARAARLEGGTQADGTQAARDLLEGSSTLVVTGLLVQRDAQHARVEIHGHAARVVPWLDLPVDAAAQAPTERFRPPGDGP